MDGDPRKGNIKVTARDWLSAAEHLLIERGVAQVKILTLAETLEVSRSSFYWYFQSRKDLLDQLLATWQARNTKAVLDHAGRPARDITVAVMNLFECFIDPNRFDPRLDFAIREWARRSPEVRAEVDRADAARIEAIQSMFSRHGYAEGEAYVRARIIYYMQIGYYALVEAEPLETRIAQLEAYLISFTGQHPDPEEMAAFVDRARSVLATNVGQQALSRA
ncbi:MAG: TetR/AcrR family transcriptional regulator [Pseudomonadota bacterium]